MRDTEQVHAWKPTSTSLGQREALRPLDCNVCTLSPSPPHPTPPRLLHPPTPTSPPRLYPPDPRLHPPDQPRCLVVVCYRPMELDPPDDFFELTTEDLVRMQQQANEKKRVSEAAGAGEMRGVQGSGIEATVFAVCTAYVLAPSSNAVLAAGGPACSMGPLHSFVSHSHVQRPDSLCCTVPSMPCCACSTTPCSSPGQCAKLSQQP